MNDRRGIWVQTMDICSSGTSINLAWVKINDLISRFHSIDKRHIMRDQMCFFLSSTINTFGAFILKTTPMTFGREYIDFNVFVCYFVYPIVCRCLDTFEFSLYFIHVWQNYGHFFTFIFFPNSPVLIDFGLCSTESPMSQTSLQLSGSSVIWTIS